MKTVLEIVNLSKKFLEERGVHSSKRSAEQVIADALGVNRLELYMQFDRPLSDEELVDCREAIQRRSKGEPPQYIRGFVEFYDCKILTDRSVLIPRQETEILVDEIAKELSQMELKDKELWDVCTGSGCIGLALKKRFPELNVVLSDISVEALQIAKTNAIENNVSVEILQGDLLEPFGARKADFIVCNPPYISEAEYQELEREVKDYEPYQALVSGSLGLECYQQLSKGLQERLNKGGRAWFEMGSGQGKWIKKLFDQAGYGKTFIKNDWSGHDRFFFLEIE